MDNFESHIPELEADASQVESVSAILDGEKQEQNTIPANVEEILLDEYTWDNEKGNQQEEYQKFQKFLVDNPDASKKCIELMVSEDPNKIADYVYENGFIINQDTYIAFLQFFGVSLEIELVEDNTELVENNTEGLESKREIEKFDDLFSTINTSILDINSLDRLLSVTEFIDTVKQREIALEEIESFFQNLQNNPQEFQKIAQSFHDAGSEQFAEFERVALQYNPNLAASFREFENNSGINSPTPESELHRAQIAAGLNNTPQSAEKYGQFMEVQDGDEITVMNIGVEPPTREVGISGSPMRLERNVPVGDFYEAISDEGLEYERFSTQNAPTIDAVYAIEQNTDAILASLEGDNSIDGAEEVGLGDLNDVETQDIGDLKKDIESQLGFPDGVTLDSLASTLGKTLTSRKDISDFIQSTDLTALLGSLKDEKESKRLAYQKALREKSFDVSESMEQGDALARDVIETFYGLGIDIAWEDLQQLLQNTDVQSHLLSVMGTNFSFEHLDLANGKFGQSGTSADSVSILHENIAKFANIIYFGEPNPEESPIQLKDFSRYSQGKVPTPTSEIIALREGNDMVINGSINKILIQDRLSGKV